MSKYLVAFLFKEDEAFKRKERQVMICQRSTVDGDMHYCVLPTLTSQ